MNPLLTRFAMAQGPSGEWYLEIAAKDPQGEPSYARLPPGRELEALHAILAQRRSPAAQPGLGYPGSPTEWETERWFQLHGTKKAKSTREKERSAMESQMEKELGLPPGALHV